MKPIIWLISLIAIGLALAIAVAGPGTRFGWWEYTTGLQILRDGALPVLIASGVCGLAFVVSLFVARNLAPVALFAALFAGAAAAVPLKMKQLVEANPFIHDITTDISNPPPIVAAAALPRVNPPAYAGEDIVRGTNLTVAEAQQQAFPDIQPILVTGSVDETAETVRNIVQSMGMEILESAPNDDGWLIEAAATSQWFGFVDDFIVRLKSEGPMTRVDVRSKSRVGGSDLGANAKRVHKFFEKLEAATA